MLGLARAAAEAAERDYARATACRLREDYTGALGAYRAAAEQGHAMAQNDLGSMLLNGLGTVADAAAAVGWYRRAADQGLAEAQFNLGMRFIGGSGVAQDDAEGARWLAQAAQQGDVAAMVRLGALFRDGRGVPQDLVAAADLHLMAADAGEEEALQALAEYRGDLEGLAVSGDPQAAVALCRMFEEGLAVDFDPVQAFAWLRWAQERADAAAAGDEGDLADELAEREAALDALLDAPHRQEALERLAAIRERAGRS